MRCQTLMLIPLIALGACSEKAPDPRGVGHDETLLSVSATGRSETKPDEARFTRLLLDRGADPNVRASIRAQLEEGHGGGPIHEYRAVTPLGWGEQYHARIFVSRESMRLVEERGGGR